METSYSFGFFGIWSPVQDELEPRIQFVLDLLAVLDVFDRIIGEMLLLFLGVWEIQSVSQQRTVDQGMALTQLTCKIASIGARKPLRKPCSDPGGRSNPGIKPIDSLRNSRGQLNATTANSNHSYSFALKL